jgi:hypothetical protein
MKVTYKMSIKRKDMKTITKETHLHKNQIFLIGKLHKDIKKKTGEILKYHRILDKLICLMEQTSSLQTGSTMGKGLTLIEIIKAAFNLTQERMKNKILIIISRLMGIAMRKMDKSHFIKPNRFELSFNRRQKEISSEKTRIKSKF